MSRIELGDIYPQKVPIGIMLDYNNGFNLLISLPDLSEEEIKEIQIGKYKFGLTIKEDILFFTCEFGKAINISDVAFHFGLYTDNRAKCLPESIEEGNGLALNVIAVDYTTRITKAIRLIGLPTDMSRELLRVSKWQSNRNTGNYEKRLKRLQMAFSSADLYEESKLKCIGGDK
ncbi:hypothetical protein IAI10_16520 [Clostridium sp. 19966]|uniref:hypothetical protein n=1 Tax=Clostridium sp. 19966 TaxID=2768166 RepID=UPI0028DE12FC|nr:hypothetical protein [Clostridium sp. 19966]MDT8718273.1 hypothetical protein [Clostridium sp. 19966]